MRTRMNETLANPDCVQSVKKTPARGDDDSGRVKLGPLGLTEKGGADFGVGPGYRWGRLGDEGVLKLEGVTYEGNEHSTAFWGFVVGIRRGLVIAVSWVNVPPPCPLPSKF